ncbi:probable phytol kinase 3, chloroplastic [Morus notabilis]|uniref:probable phytol kinase 3, chloroplastic n=1 Tax=Morus notabilis TaxID=981085 RepID=UPI000CED71FF|nr:probable phytol kinase 3, chloroplastic [Morus notabilis]
MVALASGSSVTLTVFDHLPVNIPFPFPRIHNFLHFSSPYPKAKTPTSLLSHARTNFVTHSPSTSTTSPLGPHRRRLTSAPPSAAMFSQNAVVSDIFAAAFTACVALSLLRVWGETAKRGLFDQKLNRKLVHISVGLVFMLCWPLFSPGSRGAFLAASVPGVNIIRMLLLGLGIWKDEATVKSMSRFGDYRELLKGPLYYATTITLACIIYWRTSLISIAAICNLCAGDGSADIIGRRFGNRKLPYNRSKSIAGSIAMASGGFLASVGYMYYFSSFGFVEVSWEKVLGFFIVSLATTLVESLPISTELDDNLTVPVSSILVGSLVF